MHTNTRNPIIPGVTQAIKSISVRGNIATITTMDAFARGVGVIGTWITTTGSVDDSFNGTCKVAAVNEATKQLNLSIAHVDGLTKGGRGWQPHPPPPSMPFTPPPMTVRAMVGNGKLPALTPGVVVLPAKS